MYVSKLPKTSEPSIKRNTFKIVMIWPARFALCEATLHKVRYYLLGRVYFSPG